MDEAVVAIAIETETYQRKHALSDWIQMKEIWHTEKH